MKATAAPTKKKKTAKKALRNKDGQKRTVVQHKNGTMQVVHWLDNAVSDIVGPALYHKIQTTVLNNQRNTNGTVTKTKRLLGYVKSLLYMLVVLVVYLPVPHYENTCSGHFEC